MVSVQKTYNVFRQVKDAKSGIIEVEFPDVSFTPANVTGALSSIQSVSVKTVENSLNEFFSLFTSEQADILRTKTDYMGWLQIVKEKNKMPIDKLNSPQELAEIDNILR